MKRLWLVLAAAMMLTTLAGCQNYERDTECDPELGAQWYRCPDDSQVPWCTCTDGEWDCDPQPAQACEDIPVCQADRECAPDAWCDPCATSSCPGCDDCVAGCLLHGCPTEPQPDCRMVRPDCGPDQVSVVSDGCWVCVDRQTCEPGGGRDERCDDGSQDLCEMVPPICEDYEILAIKNACWLCVNPETCMPWGESGCRTDADCDPQQRCDPCASGSCPMCPDCVPGCTAHNCSTEDELACFCARPDCGPDAVSVIDEACWVCVDAQTCEPTGDGC